MTKPSEADPEPWQTQFPYAAPAESEAEMFIQWKGTDLCMDFYCPCGTDSHLDGYSAHYVRCPTCSTIYQMSTQVIVKKVAGSDGHAVRDLEVDS